MSDTLVKILVGLGMQLLSGPFVARAIVHALRSGAKSTKWALDDQLVDDLAQGLGVDQPK